MGEAAVPDDTPIDWPRKDREPARPRREVRYDLIGIAMCLFLGYWFLGGPLMFFRPESVIGRPLAEIETKYGPGFADTFAEWGQGEWDRAFKLGRAGGIGPDSLYLVVRTDDSGTIIDAQCFQS